MKDDLLGMSESGLPVMYHSRQLALAVIYVRPPSYPYIWGLWLFQPGHIPGVNHIYPGN